MSFELHENLYNSLTTEIVNSSSPASFKKGIKAFICKKY